MGMAEFASLREQPKFTTSHAMVISWASLRHTRRRAASYSVEKSVQENYVKSKTKALSGVKK
jgi:hypothetical protein